MVHYLASLLPTDTTMNPDAIAALRLLSPPPDLNDWVDTRQPPVFPFVFAPYSVACAYDSNRSYCSTL